jgi:hypothetical protein
MQTLNYRNKVRQIPEGTIIEVFGKDMIIKTSDFKTFDRDAYAYFSIWLSANLLAKIDAKFVNEYKNKYGSIVKVFVAK